MTPKPVCPLTEQGEDTSSLARRSQGREGTGLPSGYQDSNQEPLVGALSSPDS